MKTAKAILGSITALTIAATAPNQACGQATGTSHSSANIVTPISISKTTDLQFGNAAVSASAAGTVVMLPAGVRSATGGVTLPATTGNVGAANFTITGQANYTYAITLPSLPVKIFNSSHTMDVVSFTSQPSNTGTLSAGGTQVLKVGATLQVSAGQIAGAYATTTPFNVTVNYN